MSNFILESEIRIRKAKYAVIMTSYGRDTLLKKAISSVLSQTFKDFILIIVDDNSPEVNPKTQDIIRQFVKDPRIVFFRTDTTPKKRNELSTFCRNINTILKLLLSKKIFEVEYVCYLPCDDYFLENKLEEVNNYFKLNPKSPACYHGMTLQDEKGNKLCHIPVIGYQRPIANPISNLDHSSVIHRLDLLSRVSEPYWPINKRTEHVAPDGEFFTKLVRICGPIQPIGKLLGKKLRHRNSIQGRGYKW